MALVHRTKAALQAFLKCFQPSRPKIITAEPNRQSSRIQKPARLPVQPANRLRTRLADRLTYALRRYEAITEAKIELEASNAKARAMAEVTLSHAMSRDNGLLDALRERESFREKTNAAWQKLHDAHGEVEAPLASFEKRCTEPKLPQQAVSALHRALRASAHARREARRTRQIQLQLDTVNTDLRKASRRRRVRKGWHYADAHKASLERHRAQAEAELAARAHLGDDATVVSSHHLSIIEYYNSHAHRVIRQLEMLPTNTDPAASSTNKNEEYGMTTTELYKQTQTALQIHYPVTLPPKPAPDPDLQARWTLAREELASWKATYEHYRGREYEHTAIREMIRSGEAQSLEHFYAIFFGKRQKAIDGLEGAIEEFKAARKEAMAAGLEVDLFGEQPDLDLPPFTHHFEDGTVDTEAASRHQRLRARANVYVGDMVDDWRREVLDGAVSTIGPRSYGTAPRSDVEKV